MRVFDIVTESTVNEFYRGDAARYKVSVERLRELGFQTLNNGWQPYGTDVSEWTYSDQNMIALLDEAMTEFAEHQLNITAEDEVMAFKAGIVNFMRTDGVQTKRNIANTFREMATESDPKVKHNEALGLMLNMLYAVQQSAQNAIDATGSGE